MYKKLVGLWTFRDSPVSLAIFLQECPDFNYHTRFIWGLGSWTRVLTLIHPVSSPLTHFSSPWSHACPISLYGMMYPLVLPSGLSRSLLCLITTLPTCIICSCSLSGFFVWFLPQIKSWVILLLLKTNYIFSYSGNTSVISHVIHIKKTNSLRSPAVPQSSAQWLLTALVTGPLHCPLCPALRLPRGPCTWSCP